MLRGIGDGDVEGSFWTGHPERDYVPISVPASSALKDCLIEAELVLCELRWYHVINVLNSFALLRIFYLSRALAEVFSKLVRAMGMYLTRFFRV